MEITEVRVKLMEDSDDRLRAFCSVTFDDSFVVRDLKVIDGTNGPFVAMPSRKLTSHCPKCGAKNHMRARYCNHCGGLQPQERAVRDPEGRAKLYADIAHPINSTCREMIQRRVIAEYRDEVQRAKEPGYATRYDDEYGEEDFDADFLPESGQRATTKQIQPAEATPPPPHHPAPHHPAPHQTTAPAPKARRNGFGAGVFDE